MISKVTLQFFFFFFGTAIKAKPNVLGTKHKDYFGTLGLWQLEYRNATGSSTITSTTIRTVPRRGGCIGSPKFRIRLLSSPVLHRRTLN